MQLPHQLSNAFPARPVELHKRTAGVVTVVGGSAHYHHAPVISALGARAAGAGLIQLVVPDASRIAAAVLTPEATFTKLTPTCVPPKADVTAVGMGIGVSPNSEMLLSRVLSSSAGRFVLDADALNILANWYSTSKPPVTPGQSLVLTPHAGEAARLLSCSTDDVMADRAAAANAISSRYSAITLLKGPGTIVADAAGNRTFVCPAGNPFMALGGMGDLLSGMIAARWARTGDAFEAAAAAVWLHAAAADSLVDSAPPREVNIVNTASEAASIRISLERTPR